MANYIVKLVDHTGSDSAFKEGIRKRLQGFFDEVFAGTADGTAVQWGTAVASDRIVLHFVDDVPSSYIQQQMPGKSIPLVDCGHTRTRAGSSVTGSEFYRYVGSARTRYTYTGYAKCAFHEAMHNQYPYWTNADLHGPNGGSGLAASPPKLPMTDKNKVLMRNGMAIPNSQLL
jgi:hypothetical protein